MPAQDTLELLLPEADELELGHARKVTTFLRLLTNDARPAHAMTVRVDLGRARGVLEEEDRGRLRGALLDLLAAFLTAAAGPESFLWCGPVCREPAAAWRTLEAFRGQGDALPELPAPGEPALAVARRLLASLGRVEQDARDEVRELELTLWRARLELASGDPRTAERAARRLQARARERLSGRDPEAAHRLASAALATRVEALLERGAVGAASAALSEADRPTERLRTLDAWSRLVAGDFAGARRVLVGLAPWAGPLPAALAELREHRPAWLGCLAGRAPCEEEREPPRVAISDSDPGAAGPRSDLGASVLAVFSFRAECGACPVWLEVAPGLRDGVGAWLVDREDAYAVASAPEHRLIVRARPSIVHRGTDALAGALGGAATRAIVRLPVFAPTTPPAPESALAAGGEVVGWLHLELEHHLVPGHATLARLAERWRPAVLARLANGDDPDEEAAGAPLAGTLARETCPSGEVFRELVTALGIKTHQRLWWGFELDGDAPRRVAHGGGGSGFGAGAAAASSRALERARITGGGVLFEAPEPSLSIHPASASGVVVPLRLPVPERVLRGTTTTGFLVLESSRKRDFGADELERFVRTGESFALVHLCARYRAWSQARFHVDVRLDARDEGFQVLGAHLFAAARSRAPALVAGPPGAGKRVLGRFLHFCSDRVQGPLISMACSDTNEGLGRAWNRARGGTLLLERVELLGPEPQAELARLLLPGPGSPAPTDAPPRVIATTRSEPPGETSSGALCDDLAQRFARVQVRAPALVERRVELPGLVEFLARRIAAEEGLPAPAVADETLALIWRQPWPGNVRELEALVHKLVLLHPGDTIRAQHVIELAAHHGLSLVKRLSSRRPERAAIVAALRTTRTAGGRGNKTRAALYLGWDPDTLVARMDDLGLSGPDDPFEIA